MKYQIGKQTVDAFYDRAMDTMKEARGEHNSQ